MATTTAPAVARFAGLAATSVAVAMMSALGAFQASPGHMSVQSGAKPAAPAMSSSTQAQLAEAVADRASNGLQCDTQPHLSTVVLFESAIDGIVGESTFADALRATSQGEGWIRAYCL